MVVPERYRWAVEILDVQPDDVVLEIGCGYGHSIALICEKLKNGHLTAIDRSDKMVSAASEANRQFTDCGCATVLHQELLDHALDANHFDKIFLFNINVFWMDPDAELTEIRRLLTPSGRFYLFHQPPPGHNLDEFEKAFRSNLMKNNFSIVDNFKDPRDAIRSVALIAEPNRQ